MSNCTFWADFLRQHHGQQFTDLAAPFHERMQTTFENQASLGAGYRNEADRIAEDLNTAETDLLTRLTEAAMQADESKTCFALD
jgi:hypothetical protein